MGAKRDLYGHRVGLSVLAQPHLDQASLGRAGHQGQLSQLSALQLREVERGQVGLKLSVEVHG